MPFAMQDIKDIYDKGEELSLWKSENEPSEDLIYASVQDSQIRRVFA